MTIRSLPTLRFKDPELQRAYDAVREALGEGNGERGNPDNRWVTVGDLDGKTEYSTVVRRLLEGGSTTASGGSGGPLILSCEPLIPNVGDYVIFTAVLIGTYRPSGTMRFEVDGQEIATVNVVGSLGYVENYVFATSGLHTVQAFYSGDSQNAPSTSNRLALPVGGSQWEGPPPAPLSLTATPDVWQIRLDWTNPDIGDLAVTELWGKRSFTSWNATTTYTRHQLVAAPAGTAVYRSLKTNNLNHALTDTTWWALSPLVNNMTERVWLSEVKGLSTTFTGQSLSLLSSDETWAFWVRNRDTARLTSDYFPADDVGIVAASQLDPQRYLDLLEGSITETQLYSDLGARIDLIDGPATLSNSVAQRLAAEALTRNAALLAEATARTQAIEAEAAARAQAIAAEAQAANAALTAEAATRAQAFVAEAQAREAAIAGEAAARTAAITAEIAARTQALNTEVAARTQALTDEAAARVAATSALANDVTQKLELIRADLGTAATGLSTETQLRQAGDDQLASSLTTLTARVDANVAQIKDEQIVRTSKDEALAQQITTLVSSVGDNLAAIQTEATTRASADTALSTRVDAVLASTSSNTAAIQAEQTARTTADTALSSQVSAVLATTTSNTAAIQAEETARTTADAALSTQITTVSATATANAAAIQTEATTRAAADSALSTQITTVSASTTSNTAAIQTEATTRANADAALGYRLDFLTAEVGNSNVALATEQTARADAVSALASQITTVSAQVSDNKAQISSEQTARATADSSLAQQISLVSAGAGGGFDVARTFYFETSASELSATNATLSWAGGMVRITPTTSNPQVSLAVDLTPIAGATYATLKFRIKRVSGSSWTGNVYYKTSGHGFSANYYKALANPSVAIDSYAVLDADMTALTAGGSDWVSNNILNVRLDLGAATTDVFDLDWLAIGRNAPAASVADLLTEQTARQAADTAEVTARQTLSSKLLGVSDPTGVTLPSLSSGLLYDERTARSTADATEISARQSLAATVTGFSDPTGKALATLSSGLIYEEKTARSSETAALATSISSLQATANTTTAAIAAEATARASADAAEVTARQSLSSKLTGVNDPTNVTLATLASGLLYEEQTVRALGDAVLSQRLEYLSAELGTAAASLVAEQTARADAVSALTSQVTAMTAKVAENSAGLRAEETARASTVAAEASERRTLSSSLTGVPDPTGLTLATLSAGLLYDERSARSTADATEATARQSLSSKLTGAADPTNLTLATLSSGLLYDERSARSTADATEVTARQSLSSKLTGATDPTNLTLATLTAGLLYDEKTARSSETAALASSLSTLQATVGNNTSAIAAEATARANADTTEATARQSLSSKLTGVTDPTTVTLATLSAGLLYDEKTSRASADAALSTSVSTLQADVASTTAGLGTEQTARATADTALSQQLLWLTTAAGDAAAALYQEQVARTTALDALTRQLSTLQATTGSNTAAIKDEQTARASQTSAVASSVSTLQSTVGAHTSSLQVNQQAIDGLKAQYTVKLDIDGYVSGFGLASDPVNGSPYSEFIFRADRFSLAAPANPDPNYQTDPTIPFVVTTTNSYANGVLVPPGTYLKAAYISNGTITQAKIGNGEVVNAKIGNYIASSNWNGTVNADGWITTYGSQGWCIGKAGNFDLSGGRFRGDLASDNYAAGSAGWSISRGGVAEFNTVVIRNAGQNIQTGILSRVSAYVPGGSLAPTTGLVNLQQLMWWNYVPLAPALTNALLQITVSTQCPLGLHYLALNLYTQTGTQIFVLYDDASSSTDGDLEARSISATITTEAQVPWYGYFPLSVDYKVRSGATQSFQNRRISLLETYR